jgi:hypothetical protein
MAKIKMTRLVRGRSAGARSLTKIVSRQSGAQAGRGESPKQSSGFIGQVGVGSSLSILVFTTALS